MTTMQIVGAFHRMGPGYYRTESSVRGSLQIMETGHDPSLVERVGVFRRGAILWAVTEAGRQLVAGVEALAEEPRP